MNRKIMLLCGSVALLVFAAGPAPLVLTSSGTLGGTFVIQNPVEQQTQGGAGQPDQSLWVVNNTGTPWDIDDEHFATDSGYLDPGQSASYTETMVADSFNSHILGIEAYSTGTRDAFTVSVRSNDQIGSNVYAVSYPSSLISAGGNKQQMHAAVALFSQAYQPNSFKLLPIPNSGIGGVGRALTITYTITNTGTRRITPTVYKGIYNGQTTAVAHYCPEGWPFNIVGQNVIGDPSFAWCQSAIVTH